MAHIDTAITAFFHASLQNYTADNFKNKVPILKYTNDDYFFISNAGEVVPRKAFRHPEGVSSLISVRQAATSEVFRSLLRQFVATFGTNAYRIGDHMITSGVSNKVTHMITVD